MLKVVADFVLATEVQDERQRVDVERPADDDRHEGSEDEA